jgi:hypothetical protein
VDQVRHRAGGERADRRHRAGADDVGVHLGRTGRVRALVVVDAVDRDARGAAGEALQHVLARQRPVAVELGREHLDPGRGGGQADLAARVCERTQQPRGVRRARSARHAEEDVH